MPHKFNKRLEANNQLLVIYNNVLRSRMLKWIGWHKRKHRRENHLKIDGKEVWV